MIPENIRKTFKVLAFSEEGFEPMRLFSSWKLALVLGAVSVFLQALPTSRAEISVFPNMYAFYLAKFALSLALIYAFMKAMRTSTRAETFIAATSLTYTYAMLVSIVFTYLSIIVFEYFLSLPVVSGLVRSFIPYYTSVLFGWCCENVSGMEMKWKATAVGLFAITLLFVYILYIDALLCAWGIMNVVGIGGVLC